MKTRNNVYTLCPQARALPPAWVARIKAILARVTRAGYRAAANPTLWQTRNFPAQKEAVRHG